MEGKPSASMYFVAIVCPKAIDKDVSRFKKWMKEQFHCVVALRSPAHITLVKPFWIESNWEDYMQSALDACEVKMAPFEIRLDGFSHFGKRVIYVDVCHDRRLQDLKKLVEDHFIRTFGDSLKREQMSFEPHITIANRDLKPGDFDRAWEHFEKLGYKNSFVAEHISLLKLVDGKWQVLKERSIN